MISCCLLLFCLCQQLPTADNNSKLASLLNHAKELSHNPSPSQHRKALSVFDEIIKDKARISDDSELSIVSDAIVGLLDLLDFHLPEFKDSYDTFELLHFAADHGHPKAQLTLASAYGTGIYNGLVPMDPLKSLLYEQMAALSGNPEANIAMGYRFSNGIGVPISCDIARKHYEYASNVVSETVAQRGYYMYVNRARLSEKLSTRNIRFDTELVEHYRHTADRDPQSAFNLALLYMYGSKHLEQDFDLGLYYMALAAKAKFSQAPGLLGLLLIRDIVIEGRADTKRVVAMKDILSDKSESVDSLEFVMDLLSGTRRTNDLNAMVGLALAHRHAIGVERNMTKAIELLNHSKGKHPDAGFLLGEILLSEPDIPNIADTATQAYFAAVHHGNILAIHRIGQLYTSGVGLMKSCNSAVNMYKVVVEYGDWVKGLSDANTFHTKGDMLSSLHMFSRFAALGVEVAQFNTAYMLLKSYCPPPLRSSLLPMAVHNQSECELRALQLLGLSAQQEVSESWLQIGDIHYYGRAGLTIDKEEAVRFYQVAADQHDAHANFNLGIMHEIGDGIEQDFHLAKRFYDQAAVFLPDAKNPRKVAVAMLQSHQLLQELLTRFDMVDYLSAAFQQFHLCILQINESIDSLIAWYSANVLSSPLTNNEPVEGLTVSVYGLLFKAYGLLPQELKAFLQSCRQSIIFTFSEITDICQLFPVDSDFRSSCDKYSQEWLTALSLSENALFIGLTVLFVLLVEILRDRRRHRLRQQVAQP